MTNNDELAMKPGTYAILFRDNWDGERDVYKTLATLGDDMVWYHHESGTSLIEYEGDEVLKVWPLDDGSNALSLLAERDADKKRIAELEARTVSVKLPEPPGPMSVGARTVYCGIVADVVAAFQTGLAAAGIKLEVGE